MLLLIIRVV